MRVRGWGKGALVAQEATATTLPVTVAGGGTGARQAV